MGLMGLIGLIRLIRPIGPIRPNGPNKANKANIQEKKKFGFNNTELINLVLIMFPAGSH